MPKVAEIKEINGEVWLRLELSDGPISYYTDEEIKKLRQEVILDCINSLRDILESL